MSHPCPAGCGRTVNDDDKLMDSGCWRKVPKPVQNAVYRAWDYGRGRGSAAHMAAVKAAVRAVNGKPEQQPKPGPRELWQQAGGGTPAYDRERYLGLLREHGHLVSPGDEGYEETPRSLPCGWEPGKGGDPVG